MLTVTAVTFHEVVCDFKLMELVSDTSVAYNLNCCSFARILDIFYFYTRDTTTYCFSVVLE